jgi:hypothetical protein
MILKDGKKAPCSDSLTVRQPEKYGDLNKGFFMEEKTQIHQILKEKNCQILMINQALFQIPISYI